ncbi:MULTISPECIES: sensor histidine kinase [Pseudomonas]|uniref:histidine kinase n=1 Tax=Pseudomonas quercus TaxID=2722792 RepID=A0ABX0Y987_9PSED|nr:MULTISPECIES: HAMP domain-containing sensor histidine kinase [Pseudomonas]MBF7141356.1 HAMP domain-containing histidine kinase [Pseudomonas sp. LY10J]NJO99894.1 HAMP domain-containing histidine kinase [Pseudomonas quercus]
MRTADTLFARLFGVSVIAILLAHLLALVWFHHYGFPPPPGCPPPFAQPMPAPGMTGASSMPGTWPGGSEPQGPFKPCRERHVFDGPIVPLTFQIITLVIAAWWGARYLSRPIRRFSEAAERLSENLDSPPMAETGPVEARKAAHTFNQMQQRIREQVQQRARMLGAVSHDLRTPLSRLKLRLEQLGDEKLQMQMRQDLDDMIGMLDATLTYLHEQRTSEALQLYDVQALVESLCENAQDNGLPAEARGHCTPLRTQPMALRSCLSNLLDNALRYGGATQVALADGPTHIIIRVIDHGPGISAEKREAVFEPFFRLEGSRNRNSGGVGLGMTIAREAAQRLNGSLALDETPGGGLTAIVRLPRL